MNLENGPILLDEEWRDACWNRAKENHVQSWNGLPGIRYKKKIRFKRPKEIADGDGLIFHNTKQTSCLRQTQLALLPKFPNLCVSRNQFYLLQIPEELPVEAAVLDERTRAVDEPVAELFFSKLKMLMRQMMINWLQPAILLKVICLMKQMQWVLAIFHHQSIS